MEKPHRMAVLSGWPESRKPKVPKMLWPKMMASVITTMAGHWSITTLMSTSMPTDTKKIAPKRFLTGSMSFSIFFASMVSARMLPITNEPKAELKPTLEANTAIAQQRASETMSSTSSLMSRRTFLRKIGTRNRPTTNHSTRKKTMDRSADSSPVSSPPVLALSLLATVVRTTIRTMARMSSSMSTLMTSDENCCCRSPRSSKALYMMVVDDMASIPARKSPFRCDQPKSSATITPILIMQNMMVSAAMIGAMPILRIFLIEKSRPRAKSRNITPMSAHVWIFSLSMTDMVKVRLGDTMNPAMI